MFRLDLSDRNESIQVDYQKSADNLITNDINFGLMFQIRKQKKAVVYLNLYPRPVLLTLRLHVVWEVKNIYNLVKV